MTGEFTLHRDPYGRLVLTGDSGALYAGVEAVRAFPLSDPLHAISLCDSDGREIVYIDSIESLAPEIRSIVEEELANREFVPLIVSILNTPPETEPAEWQVETDRGVTTFQLDSEDNVHRLDAHQVSIVDSRGIRYLIPDARRMDSHSRRVIDRFL